MSAPHICSKEKEIDAMKNSLQQIQLELNGLGNTPGLKTEVDRLVNTTGMLSKSVETFTNAIEKINKFMLSHEVKEEVIQRYEDKITEMKGERKKRNWAVIVSVIGWMLTLAGLYVALNK